jgi:hypothetical protein
MDALKIALRALGWKPRIAGVSSLSSMRQLVFSNGKGFNSRLFSECY